MRWLTFAGRQPVKFWLEAIYLERRVLKCEITSFDWRRLKDDEL